MANTKKLDEAGESMIEIRGWAFHFRFCDSLCDLGKSSYLRAWVFMSFKETGTTTVSTFFPGLLRQLNEMKSITFLSRFCNISGNLLGRWIEGNRAVRRQRKFTKFYSCDINSSSLSPPFWKGKPSQDNKDHPKDGWLTMWSGINGV